MKQLRRFTAAITASFDQMVSQIENHEALVDQAIQEAQDAACQARVQLHRVKQDGQRMQQRTEELRGDEQRWKERAVKVAALNEQRALECVKRAQRARNEYLRIERQEAEHAKVQQQLVQDLQRIDTKIGELRQQRNLLKTRQSRAAAFKAIKQDQQGAFSQVESILDRWETKVAAYEWQGECQAPEMDELAAEFSSEEEEETLRAGLRELLEQQDSMQQAKPE